MSWKVSERRKETKNGPFGLWKDLFPTEKITKTERETKKSKIYKNHHFGPYGCFLDFREKI